MTKQNTRKLDQVVALRKKGLTYQKISDETGIPTSTVAAICTAQNLGGDKRKKKVAKKKISATHRTTKTTKVIYDDTPTKPALDEGSDPSNMIALAAMTIIGFVLGYFVGVGI